MRLGCALADFDPTVFDPTMGIRTTTMRTRFGIATIVLLSFIASPATAATKEEKRVADATDVVDQLLRIPEQSIPPSLLDRAYGVAVIPNMIKAGFVVGRRYGKGILVVRQPDNTWSNPAFIRMTGGSVGWQAGAQSTDIILVFKTPRSVDGIAKGKLTLGAGRFCSGRARRPAHRCRHGHPLPLGGLLLLTQPRSVCRRRPRRCGAQHGP